MNEPIRKEFLIFTETAEFNDSVAYIVNSYMKYYLELMMQRKINDSIVTNLEAFAQTKFRGRHPRSILERTHPTMSLSYVADYEPTERALSSSPLTTPVQYIDPRLVSDTLFENSDKADLTKNLEVALQWSDTELNCDVALVEETYALQTTAKKAWDTLFEKDKEYSIFAEVKFPLSDTIFNVWCETFGLDKNDLDAVMKHMQERSPVKLSRELALMNQIERIHIRIPMEILISFSQSDLRTDNEQDYVIGAYIVHRLLNVRFNAPRLYWIIPKERYPHAPIMKPRVIIEHPGEIEVDRINDTYINEDGIVFAKQVHELIFFEGKNDIISLIYLLDEWHSFINWLVKNNISFKKAFFIVIRENNDISQATKYTSSEKVGISYGKELLVKLMDKDMIHKSFDVKIYINMLLHNDYREYEQKFVFNDYESVIDTAGRGEIKVSNELLDLING